MKLRNILLSILLAAAGAWGADYFDWNSRTDRYGFPAGYLDSTAFPIDENSTTYMVKNDENPTGKTYTLGTLYFVDSARADNSGDGTSLATAEKTIAAAIADAGSGNKTIVVRRGTYFEYNMAIGTGTDDTHRWMIVGYKQERPIIDASANTDHSIDVFKTSGSARSFATIQRLKIQNNQGQAVRLGTNTTTQRDDWFNLYDVWIRRCGWYWRGGEDGNCYLLNVDSSRIFHATSEYSYGHTMKVGDGSSNDIVEWSVLRYAGYFAGMDTNEYWGAHAGNLHIVSDLGVYGVNNVVRYNILDTALFDALELRRAVNYSVHHNEMWGSPQFNNISGAETHGMGVGDNANALVVMNADSTYGNWYSNVCHDAGKLESGNEAAAIGITAVVNNGANVTYFFNNLFYGFNTYTIYQKNQCTNMNFELYNNTVVDSASQVSFYLSNATGTRVLQNNLIYNMGAGACVTLGSGYTKNNNLYYYPNGSRGYANPLETGGKETNPNIVTLPTHGTFIPTYVKFSSPSPALDSGATVASFASDIFDKARPQKLAWDIGAYEYNPKRCLVTIAR